MREMPCVVAHTYEIGMSVNEIPPVDDFLRQEKKVLEDIPKIFCDGKYFPVMYASEVGDVTAASHESMRYIQTADTLNTFFFLNLHFKTMILKVDKIARNSLFKKFSFFLIIVEFQILESPVQARVRKEDVDRIIIAVFIQRRVGFLSSSVGRDNDIGIRCRSDPASIDGCVAGKRAMFLCFWPRYGTGYPKHHSLTAPRRSATLRRVSRNRPRALGNFLLITRQPLASHEPPGIKLSMNPSYMRLHSDHRPVQQK